ncbi:MAG: chemotaxis protein CheA [Sulfurimonas sp.]|uniref:chemotaxis protein CheA n=1 Tax=Sulfurimonas sp. TaxID=2022749 RepID=UPI00261F3317|nr:chemotaxis protein CheA [Sulfurimonas sp.]MDD2652548.1 chemotaxis protein CheA [Sulfurimonas sp.]MDD3451277.1 chemotaxis protein CheA [Sulfurimonas sp.]
MISQEELRAIFIEEATEIVEKLDVDIIRFEENSNDFELLNEIFRGVHTLKGNSNAFGFTRLGEFVHHFEDLLDYYRSTKERIEANNLELFVESVDVVKEVMECELNSIKELPRSYSVCLEKIKKLLDAKKNKNPSLIQSESREVLNNLALEFDELPLFPDEDTLEQSIKIHQAMQTEALNLYKIVLTLDGDCYKRGFDHFIFLKILGEQAKSLESFFSMKNVQTIEDFQSTQNSIDKVDIVALTPLVYGEVEEIFEFLFDHEYKITPIQAPPPPQKETEKEAETLFKSASNNNTEIVSNTNINAPKSTIRIDTYKVDELFDSVGELVIAQNFIAQNREIRSIENETINRTIEVLSKITKKIQDRVMSLRMVAIKDTFEKMKRVVRDTSKKTGKEIHLIIQGEDTEIDKTMIDSLSDPLIHIIRNAIDHGLESCGDERVSIGKSAEGTLTLRAFHKSGNIVISVSDDGRGINKERVFKKAIERGIVNEGENLTDSQIFALIMQPGFSTAEAISDLSGRGVGLDVVKTSIEKLRGKIEIESKEGEGTTFSIILPLTLAIIDGMLVQVGNETYIIPTLCVVESFRPEKEIVHIVKGKGEFVTLRKECIPIVRLSEVFNLDIAKSEPWENILVCVETDSGRIAIMIDELLGRQQVVIKTLGKSLSKVKEISGGAILGNGDIALILNVDALRPQSETSHVRD